MTPLEQIRNTIRERNEVKPCPVCTRPLTIEKTQYFYTELCEHCFQHSRIVYSENCCNNPQIRPSRLITSAGTVQVKNQCATCGDVSGSAIGGYTQAQKEQLPIIDTQAREGRGTFINRLVTSFYAKVREMKDAKYQQDREQNRKEWFSHYNQYLSSPSWREKRERVLKRDGYMCQACLKNTATQVHHKSYQFVDMQGSEPCFDLASVCGPCHDKIEAMKKEIREQQQ